LPQLTLETVIIVNGVPQVFRQTSKISHLLVDVVLLISVIETTAVKFPIDPILKSLEVRVQVIDNLLELPTVLGL
jgi:hypothetical protein